SRRQPVDRSGGQIGLELRQHRAIGLRRQGALAQFAMKCGHGFGLSEGGTGYVIRRGEFPHFVISRIVEIKPDQITGIEIDHRSSRSAEMPAVASVPGESFIAWKAGRSLRRAK